MNDKMWLKPNVEDDSLGNIWEYALSIDGYKYAREHFNKDCAEIANPRLDNFHLKGFWEGSFEELRCCLFFEQRRYHHFGYEPEDKDLAAIKMLYWTVATKWYQETD